MLVHDGPLRGHTPALPRRASQRRHRVFSTPLRALLGSLFSKQVETPSDQLPAATLQWLRSQGLPPQQLAARECGAAGRGLVSTTRIRRGALLRVPRQLVLTADDALAASQCSAVLERADLPAWSVLAFFLVEAKLGQASPWQPYVCMLPEACDCVLEWEHSQVDSLLAGMQLQQDAHAIRSAADTSWQQLQPVLDDRAALAAFGGRQPSRADFQWAFSMLLSRLIRLGSLGDTEALVPWADLLNHSPDVDSCLDWDASLQSVVLQAEAPAEPGQQLFVSYGAKPSGALLLSYGFVPEGVNRHEAVDLHLALRDDDALHTQKAQALAALGLPSEQRFPLKLGAFPAGSLLYAAILAVTDGDALQSAWAAQRTGDEQRLDATTRFAALTLVRDCCTQRLEAMAASVPQSEAPNADASRLERLVTDVRVRERRILERARFLLTQERTQLRGLV